MDVKKPAHRGWLLKIIIGIRWIKQSIHRSNHKVALHSYFTIKSDSCIAINDTTRDK